MLVWEEDMVRALRKERESLREENARLRAEVKRLEGLIVDWSAHSGMEPGLRYASDYALWDEAKRIRGEK